MDQHPYLPQTPAQIAEMLAAIGVRTVEDLFSDIPGRLLLTRPPEIPPALSESDLQAELGEIAMAEGAESALRAGFPLGGGWEPHARSVLVDRLAKLPEFYSAYTPYQAEASQGILQAFHEFQTMIARLFGCDIANASLYDGATALAEAAFMASDLTRGRTRFLVSETLSPQHRAVLKTYFDAADCELVTLPHRLGATDWDRAKDALDDETAALIAANPNHFGVLDDLRAGAEIAHARGALLIAATAPLLLGVLEPPGAMGADIVVADGVSLGLTPCAGGDALGLFACREEYLRKMPGRLVGLTKDTEGRRAYTLTLQTREQHIRREKATSNICTNQGLHALRTAIHLALAGPRGLREVGLAILGAATAAREAVTDKADGWALAFPGPWAQSFVIRADDRPREIGISSAGLPLEQHFPGLHRHFLVTAEEFTTRDDIDAWIQELTGSGHHHHAEVRR